MAKSKVRKPKKGNQYEGNIEGRAFNPTKSKIGRIIILVLALGMVLGLFISAIIGAINVLEG